MDQPSVSYSFDGNLFHFCMRGTYTPADIKREFVRALGDANFPSDARMLFDVTQSASLATRTPEDVRDMAKFLASHSDRIGRRFAIAATKDIQYGFMRMGQVYSEISGVEVKVFRSVEEARLWLLGSAPSSDARPPSC